MEFASERDVESGAEDEENLSVLALCLELRGSVYALGFFQDRLDGRRRLVYGLKAVQERLEHGCLHCQEVGKGQSLESLGESGTGGAE